MLRGQFRAEIAALNAEEILPPIPTTRETAPPVPAQPTAPFRLQWLYLRHHAPHIIVAGPTNAGKSTFSRALLADRSYTEQVIIMDPHNRGRSDLPGMSENWGVETRYIIGHGANYGWIAATMQYLIDELESRIERSDRGDHTYGPVTILLDEWPAIAAHPLCAGIAPRFMGDLSRQARKYRMRLVILAQDANLKTLGLDAGDGKMRRNFLNVLLKDWAIQALPAECRGVAFPIVLEAENQRRFMHSQLIPDLAARPVNASALWLPVAEIAKGSGILMPLPPGSEPLPALFDVLARMVANDTLTETEVMRELGVKPGGSSRYKRYKELLHDAMERVEQKEVAQDAG